MMKPFPAVAPAAGIPADTRPMHTPRIVPPTMVVRETNRREGLNVLFLANPAVLCTQHERNRATLVQLREVL